MAKTKANEREFAGQVIHWIKEQLKEGGLPFESATNDSGLYGLASVKFPDVLLTLDFEGLRPFCGWELEDAEDGCAGQGIAEGSGREGPGNRGEVLCYVEYANSGYLEDAGKDEGDNIDICSFSLTYVELLVCLIPGPDDEHKTSDIQDFM